MNSILNEKYCYVCFRIMGEWEKVAREVSGLVDDETHMACCCMDCFNSMTEVPYDND